MSHPVYNGHKPSNNNISQYDSQPYNDVRHCPVGTTSGHGWHDNNNCVTCSRNMGVETLGNAAPWVMMICFKGSKVGPGAWQLSPKSQGKVILSNKDKPSLKTSLAEVRSWWHGAPVSCRGRKAFLSQKSKIQPAVNCQIVADESRCGRSFQRWCAQPYAKITALWWPESAMGAEL